MRINAPERMQGDSHARRLFEPALKPQVDPRSLRWFADLFCSDESGTSFVVPHSKTLRVPWPSPQPHQAPLQAQPLDLSGVQDLENLDRWRSCAQRIGVQSKARKSGLRGFDHSLPAGSQTLAAQVKLPQLGKSDSLTHKSNNEDHIRFVYLLISCENLTLPTLIPLAFFNSPSESQSPPK